MGDSVATVKKENAMNEEEWRQEHTYLMIHGQWMMDTIDRLKNLARQKGAEEAEVIDAGRIAGSDE